MLKFLNFSGGLLLREQENFPTNFSCENHDPSGNTLPAGVYCSGIILRLVVSQTKLIATGQLREASHRESNTPMGQESTLQCMNQM